MKTKVKKQTKHLKAIWLARNICDVMCIAFGFGFFFCVLAGMIDYETDFFAAVMFAILSGLLFVTFGVLELEFRQIYETDRNAFMAENIEHGIRRTLLNNRYERD